MKYGQRIAIDVGYQDKMTDFVLQNRLFTKRDRIGVALSGGADPH